jgi:hypothetical protein
MPTVEAALAAMHEGYRRLEDLGFRDAVYCPKDGTEFEVIEPGSTGVHRCIYEGDWPSGTWFILADRDLWPSRPILFRPIPPEST